MTFRGFPPAAFDFYERLEADNTKAFWQANRTTFDDAVNGPMRELCLELGDLGPFHVFRPYNDVRFAKNRPAYKTHLGAYAESEGGSGYYVRIGADGMMVGVGQYRMASDQLARYRAAVDHESTGTDAERIVAALAGQGYSTSTGDELKSAPRGFPRDHPRIELLRHKSITASRHFPVASWMRSTKAAAKVRDTWRDAEALIAWLDANVGPSTLPPDQRMGGRRG